MYISYQVLNYLITLNLLVDTKRRKLDKNWRTGYSRSITYKCPLQTLANHNMIKVANVKMFWL